ncbi:hypothetical protein B6N31_16975 [Dickeya fangzhongdai]|nr:hypothetical protein B6N31_16975 [Dickeya fangzhongdai]
MCSTQLKLATALEFFQYRFSDSFGVTRSYPRNVDTALSEVLVFKLFRAETATGTVASPPIVIVSAPVLVPHTF